MNLRENLESTMHEAMRNKDDITRDTIRMVFSAIKQVEVETRKPVDDQSILAILQKEVKIRTETISELALSDRKDLVDKSKVEISILEKFLPAQLSDEDLASIINNVMKELSASSPADMGKIMKTVLPMVKGKAQPDRVSRIVKELLDG